MDDLGSSFEESDKENKPAEISYSSEKDFYRGIGGELRYKAEGLFKKAREKGISIEEIDVTQLKTGRSEFPGLGEVELPVFIVKVKGKHLESGQIIMDAKQIDYFNRYQKYAAEKIEKKNFIKDEKGKILRENGAPKIKNNPELFLTEWEKFDIGKSLIEDKEFGLEKTITGACDRVIRKLMGENDWLYPEEAKLLDEEFDTVQAKIVKDQESKKQAIQMKKATERQINYLKVKIRNLGLDPEDAAVRKEVLKQSGYDLTDYEDLSTGEASKMIDSLMSLIPKVKDAFVKANKLPDFSQNGFTQEGENFKQ